LLQEQISSMTTNSAIFEYSRNLSHAVAVEDAPQRTRYVVKLTAVGVFAGANHKWFSNAQHALPFDFMTTAIAFAVDALGLTCEEFSIEAI
jgi:hypothetical protein